MVQEVRSAAGRHVRNEEGYMPEFRHRARTAIIAGAVLALGASGATAFGNAQQKQDRSNGSAGSAGSRSSSFSAQHGGLGEHLPSKRENIEVVGQVELKAKFGNVVAGQIADVAVFKNTAYLNSWATACDRGGTFVVDITDPAHPVETGHIPAPAGSYHGEGAHAITLDTATFKGDVLGVNNEPCNGGPGGFDLIDITNPKAPVILKAGFGDTGGENVMTGAQVPHSNHSIFLWQFNGKAYAVTVDNIEANDIDIFDISDPRNPVPVKEYDLFEDFDPDFEFFPESTTDNAYFHHDSVVKMINGTPILLTSYWDAGYETFDISDPANPVHISDSSFEGPDPLLGVEPQEGNAHYGEFSHDNKYILAADEDFSAYRPGTFTIDTGTYAGEYPATAPSGSRGVVVLPDRKLNGFVVYGGYGCPPGSGDDPANPGTGALPQRSAYRATASGEEAILVLSRGPSGDPAFPYTGCFPGEKVGAAQAAGWDAVILVDRHVADLNEAICGSGAYADTTTIPSICTTHRAFHAMFNDPPDNDPDYTPNSEPAVGAMGELVTADSLFDGWGYAHLYKNTAGTLEEVGAYAIEESLDPRFSFGFGDLSIHEWAADPTENIAYSSYYSGGVRVASFGPGGIKETGAFIDVGGSNFWGIEQYTTGSGERLLAASDRDYGLYILRYTGPGAAKPPACEDVAASTEAGKSVSVALKCTDANGNVLKLTIAGQPAHGSLGAITGGSVTYTPAAGFTGDDTFTYRANDGAANSALATARIRVTPVAQPAPPVPVPPLPGSCGFRIIGTSAADTLNGTVNADTILGGGGNDRISGQQGNDCLLGDDGDDAIDGGSGDDRMEGGTGIDRMFGDSGKDVVRGNAGNDHLRGSSGDDRLRGDDGDDYLSGGSNNDSLVGGSGKDSLRGDAGNDVIQGNGGDDSIDTGKGRNTVSAGTGNDKISAVNGQRDVITCGPGRDVVRADSGDRVAGSCERVLRTRPTSR
jgi:hypothetical protein